MNDKVIHWYDLDGTLWKTSAMWWIVDKENAESPLVKITPHEGALVLSGAHKWDGFKIHYNGFDGWLSKETYLKVQRCKTIEADRLGLSWREFTDQAMINQQADSIEFLLHHVQHLKDTQDTIRLLTARGNKQAHALLMERLQDEMDELNIQIDGSVFVNDPENVQLIGDTGQKKCQVVLESLMGYKIEREQFVPIQVERFGTAHFYDDEQKNIERALEANDVLRSLLNNTQPWLRSKIEDLVRSNDIHVNVHEVCSNELNPFKTDVIKIDLLK